MLPTNICSKVGKANEKVTEVLSGENCREEYKPFITEGYVSLVENATQLKPIKILRDTGAGQSLLLEGILPLSDQSSAGASVLIQGIECGTINVPLHVVNLKSDLVSGPVTVGIRPTLPVQGISLLLGNDLAGDKVMANPQMTSKPSIQKSTEQLEQEFPGTFPVCAVTRAMSKKLSEETSEMSKGTLKIPTKVSKMSLKTSDEDDFDLSDTFMGHPPDGDGPCHSLSTIESSNSVQDNPDVNASKLGESVLDKEYLVREQRNDPKLGLLLEKALSEDEAKKVPVCYFDKNGILMRKWRPSDASPDEEWRTLYQIVVPPPYRNDLLSLAHETPMAGHLGITKTYNKIVNHFYWPGIRHDVAQFCKTCHTCQMVGKPNQKIPTAPLQPIPAFEEPFSRVIIDCVGALPKTRSGNQYLLTIMCASTRFPEAIPLRKITAPVISKALVKFFTLVGLPKSVQSDQGSNFMSNIFQQVMHELDIKQYKSSAYHPQSQGALERFHQTLKSMMKKYCLENQADWDEGVPLLLFAMRESVQESLGFSPFELVFGHTVRGPLKLVKEKWLTEETQMNLLNYVSTFKERLSNACEMARENLENAQKEMKTWYDTKARSRKFKPGDKVLILLPIPGHPLRAQYHGPCVIDKKVSDVNYIVHTPERRKSKQLCHVNMLKEYYEREMGEDKIVAITTPVGSEIDHKCTDDDIETPGANLKLNNSDILTNLGQKLNHLLPSEQRQLRKLIGKYKHLFPDVPSRTNAIFHDVDVGDASPIKQHPYRVNIVKLEQMRKEVKYMLENDIIEPSHSDWSSPCILVPKPDNSVRFCTDFRKVNSVTKTDSYPIPRIDDCIDRIGSAKYVSKFDLLKGYWQVPLTERAKEISAFVTPDGLYQYKVMPFGMKNAPATFQRFVNNIIASLEGCEVYIDDIVVYSNSWDQHVDRIHSFFESLTKANLTVNLTKSEFGKAYVTFLGHVVGQGQVKPILAKIEAMMNSPVPTCRRGLMRFLGTVGSYRKLCRNFSDVVYPLTKFSPVKIDMDPDIFDNKQILGQKALL